MRTFVHTTAAGARDKMAAVTRQPIPPRGLPTVLVLCVACAGILGCTNIGNSAFTDASPVDAPAPVDAADIDAPVPLIDAAPCPADWWDCTYLQRRPLTIDNIDQNENLANFPVLVVITAPRFDYGQLGADGVDVRFTDGDGTPLSHEIDHWQEDGTSTVWVKVPQIDASSDTDLIWMYWNNGGPQDPPDPTDVWSNGFAAVWHHDADPAAATPASPDSTANGNHGAANGDVASIEGTIGSAVNFDGDFDWLEIPDSASLDIAGDKLTLSAWAYMTASQINDMGLIIKSDGQKYNYQLGVEVSDKGNFRVRSPILDVETVARIDSTTVLDVAKWYYIVGVYDGVNAKIYVDADLETTLAHTGNIVTSPAVPVVVGRRGLGDDRFFNGRIDEARVANIARSPAWIAAEYLTMSDAYLSYGDVETQNGPP